MNPDSKAARAFQLALPFLTLALGAGAGWYARGPSPQAVEPSPPEAWVAQVEGGFISTAMFVDEMRRRGGLQPGQYRDLAQKRALLDDLVLREAMVQAAREEGMDQEPEIRRALDQMLANQYLQRTLRERQRAVVISD